MPHAHNRRGIEILQFGRLACQCPRLWVLIGSHLPQNESPFVTEVYSVRGHRIRLTLRQRVHIMENHDYMACTRELILETVADSDELLEGGGG